MGKARRETAFVPQQQTDVHDRHLIYHDHCSLMIVKTQTGPETPWADDIRGRVWSIYTTEYCEGLEELVLPCIATQ